MARVAAARLADTSDRHLAKLAGLLQDAQGTLWRRFVDADSVYANTSYGNGPGGSDLLLRDGRTGRPAFFTTANPSPELVSQLEDVSGQFNVTTAVLWAERDTFDRGELAFFSPCVDAASGAFTTSVPLENTPGACAQKHTTHGPLGPRGTALSVSPSYQLSYASLPWRASGKLGGATLKAQFATAFALRDQLDFIFIGTFNEHIAQPQANPYVIANPHALSLGLGDSAAGGRADSGAEQLWVDMYGDGITRDVEPSVSDRGAMWHLLTSCLRVLAAAEDCSGAANGAMAAEACCDTEVAAQRWLAVWALSRRSTDPALADWLVTVDAAERASLVQSGSWEEVCTPFGGASAFCDGNASTHPTADYTRGPFLLHAAPQVPPAAPSLAVFRCYGQRHFVAADPTCYGRVRRERQLGFTSSVRDSNTPRSLRSCVTASGAMYHSLDALCGAADDELGHLGYVH